MEYKINAVAVTREIYKALSSGPTCLVNERRVIYAQLQGTHSQPRVDASLSVRNCLMG